MALRISEYGGYASGRLLSQGGVATSAPIQSQFVPIGSSVLTITLSSGTRLIFADADAGCIIFIGSSSSTGLAQIGSSTGPVAGCQRIPPNVSPMAFFVQPYARLCAVST